MLMRLTSSVTDVVVAVGARANGTCSKWRKDPARRLL